MQEENWAHSQVFCKSWSLFWSYKYSWNLRWKIYERCSEMLINWKCSEEAESAHRVQVFPGVCSVFSMGACSYPVRRGIAWISNWILLYSWAHPGVERHEWVAWGHAKSGREQSSDPWQIVCPKMTSLFFLHGNKQYTSMAEEQKRVQAFYPAPISLFLLMVVKADCRAAFYFFFSVI